jgi:hypothetical protein
MAGEIIGGGEIGWLAAERHIVAPDCRRRILTIVFWLTEGK